MLFSQLQGCSVNSQLQWNVPVVMLMLYQILLYLQSSDMKQLRAEQNSKIVYSN